MVLIIPSLKIILNFNFIGTEAQKKNEIYNLLSQAGQNFNLVFSLT